MEKKSDIEKLFEIVPSMVCVASIDGYFKYMNPEWEKVLGYSLEELLSRPLFDFIHPDDHEPTQREINRQIEGNMTLNFQNRYRCKDGSYKVLEWRATPAKGDSLFAVAIDVTDRKRMEAALRRSHEMSKRTESIANIGSWEWEISTDKVTWSDELFHIFQLDPDDRAPSWAEHTKLYHPEDFEKLRQAVETAVADEKPYELEFRTFRKDGEIRICKAKGFPETGKDGQVVRLFGFLQDITDSKRTEEILRESENQFRQVFENMSSGLAIYEAIEEGEDFVFKDFNKAAEKIEQISKDEVIGKRVTSVFPRVVEFGLLDVFKNVWRTGLPEKHPLTFYKDERIEGWRDNYIYKLPSGQIVAIYDDITERKQAEEEQRKLKTQLSNAMEIAHLGHWEYDVVNDLFTLNDQFYKIFRTTAEQVGGYRMSSDEYARRFVYPEDMDMVGEEIRKSIETSDPNFNRQLEHRMLYADGEVGYIAVLYFIVKDEQGKTVKTYGVNQDITLRKAAEEALKLSMARLELATTATNIGYWDWDLISNEVYFSSQWKCQIGYQDNELPNRFEEWESRLHPDDHDRVKRAVREYIEGRSPEYSLEFRLRHKDGSYRWIYTRADMHFRDDGKPVRMFGCHIDITDRKRMEEELIKAHKIESLGILAGGIAHDFNNILTTIIGNVSMAKGQSEPKSELFELLDETEIASKRAQALTRQLLTFAKGGAPVKEVTSLKNIIKESSLFARRGAKSISEFSIAEDLWPVEVDVGQISQVINNIVINANQAMPEGGTIEVAAGNLTIDENDSLPLKTGEYIRVSFKDQGIGIPEKYHLKIFDPYFSTKQEGSGLGLATTYSIIKKHNGHITVDSQPGIGTTFHIYLPASEKVAPEKMEDKVKEGQGRILVMDDEASLGKMVVRMLGKLGYESDLAKNGAEAIEMYKRAEEDRKRYDAVILDLTVPGGMGGKEAIQKLLEIDPEIKGIVSSGYSDDPVLANFQDYGFKGMMPKPFESVSLSKVLHEVLKGEKE